MWFFKRNLRYGTSSIIIYRNLYGVFYGNFLKLKKLIYDFIKLFLSLFNIFKSKKYLFSSLMYFIRIIGVVLGLFGYQAKEY